MALSTPQSLSVSRRGSVRGDADHTVLWVRGEQDIATRESLAVAIAGAANIDDAELVVDLSGVTFIDASTIGTLVGSAKRLRSRGRSLVVRAPSPTALRLLELCGLDSSLRAATARVVHPLGLGAALSTWVDVPPGDPTAVGARGVVVARAPRELARPAQGLPGAEGARGAP